MTGSRGHGRRQRHRPRRGDRAGEGGVHRRPRRPPPRAAGARPRPEAGHDAVAHRPATSATRRRWRRSSPRSTRGSAGSTCCSTTPASARPAVPLEDLDRRAVAVRDRDQPHRRVPLHAGGLPADEAPVAARRADHQQRLDLGAACPARNSAPYTATKHAITGLTRSTSLDGRAYDIACGQIDIGNAATDLTEPMRTTGVLQADGTIEREPTIDVAHVAAAVVYMATCRSTPTSSS